MSDMDHNSQIDETQIFRLAMQDAEDESLETLEAAADIFDQLHSEPHVHAWTPTSGMDRLVGDVWQDPYECGCGATAWKMNWCGTIQFVDIQMPKAPSPRGAPDAGIGEDASNVNQVQANVQQLQG